MGHIAQLVIAIAALVLFVWMLLTAKKRSGGNAEIDPGDARQIGLLIGMIGGSINDAVIAQSALRRFEEQHGRKATVKEMAIVAGMMRSGQ